MKFTSLIKNGIAIAAMLAATANSQATVEQVPDWMKTAEYQKYLDSFNNIFTTDDWVKF